MNKAVPAQTFRPGASLKHSQDAVNEARSVRNLVTYDFMVYGNTSIAICGAVIGTVALLIIGIYAYVCWKYPPFSSGEAHFCKIGALASASTIGASGVYWLTSMAIVSCIDFTKKAEQPAQHQIYTKL